jgi:hypothetical protein
MIPKKQIQIILIILRGTLNLPKSKGPFSILLRVQMIRHKKGIPYDTLIEITAALITALQYTSDPKVYMNHK